MLRSELDFLGKPIYQPLIEQIPIDLAGDKLFTHVKNWYDEYNIAEGCLVVNIGNIKKSMNLFANEYKEFTTDNFKGIKNKKEFKGIFYSFGEGEDYDNHDGMYHRKDSDHESRDDEDHNNENEDDEEHKDENHEDEHNRDEDDKCYQRRSYYPSAPHANEGRQEFAYYHHEEQSQTY
ncbi:hypothetical protein C922_05851 [Plasmodium inui San Antonio 1]|uniref:Uncharacterized protein n=1 Tax=Plasmodium inui San Antonio 1 TaxID=1237626 RepID=W6ZS92_9APIC|nr:hypothetical protein C922_05851 [Plasmodium inui San Antonio 1]EUD63062.1 hypothetical protein C922_05851 [Plasmodium inui San Antonio 1]